ncbi:MAG: hypothetical protein AB7I59_18220 [Geminicoccaceae bacterium]
MERTTAPAGPAVGLGEQVRVAARLAGRLRGYVRRQLSPEAIRRLVAAGLQEREQRLLRMLEHVVFGRPENPYGRLFAHAGIGLAEMRGWLAEHGLETTLGTLAEAGIYLSLDEFKGRRPVRRGSLEFRTSPHDFDNPLSSRDISLQTGGSRGGGTRIYLDLDNYGQDAAYHYLMLEAFGLLDRPAAVWAPMPPFSAGMADLLRAMKLARSPERWFAQTRPAYDRRSWRHALLGDGLILGARLCGASPPRPEFTPLDQAHTVAEWLAAVRARGRPGVVKTNVASGIRVCLAARERGLDISGSFFRVDSEPLTPARAGVFARADCSVANTYAMTEAGWVGVPCARAEVPDTCHLLSDRIALVRREMRSAHGAGAVANLYTTLLPTTPKLMLNVDCGDFSALSEAPCGCLFDQLGYRTRLHTIRSYDKLTSEGMNFLGDDLHRLLEEVLPRRFGGSPLDYQLVETESGDTGLPQVVVVASPRVGPLAEAAVVGAVVEFLDHLPSSGGTFGRRWQEAGTLRLERRDPTATGAGKMLALHVSGRSQGQTSNPAA